MGSSSDANSQADQTNASPSSQSALSAEQAADIQKELRRERSFSLADAIAQEGGSFMKGACPIPPLQQAIGAIKVFISRHLDDDEGALEPVLAEWVTSNEAIVSQHLEQPLQALIDSLTRILNNPGVLYEIARRANMKWGEIYDERPRFQRPGQPAPQGIAYSHEDLQASLATLQQLAQQALREAKRLNPES